MKKAIVSLAAAVMLVGPLSAVSSANPIRWIKENGVPQSSCEWQEALGVVNVRACEEDDW